MNSIQTSAPGKVIISGEYAVLDGAPAICMALDRRAYVSVTESDAGFHSVLAPGHSQSLGRFTASHRGIEWLDGASDFPLLTAVWQELAAIPLQHLSIVLDTNEFNDANAGIKLGVGSSAALTVALAAALDLVLGGGRSVDRIASDAHRRLQKGAGSGADIACSLRGGVIAYRMGETTQVALQWPADLHYALLWSGVSANTPAQLHKLAAAARGVTRAELGAVASEVVAAWRGGQVAAIINSLRVYTAALHRFDVEHELGIFAAGHAALVTAAESSGVLYKPCGAGGGDLGIVFATEEAAIDAFVALARNHGFRQVTAAIDASGLRCDGGQA
jgi:phosphomevalonate kinase